MKVQFKNKPLLQYSVVREGIGFCEVTKRYCPIFELNSGMEVSVELMRNADGTLTDYVDVLIELSR